MDLCRTGTEIRFLVKCGRKLLPVVKQGGNVRCHRPFRLEGAIPFLVQVLPHRAILYLGEHAIYVLDDTFTVRCLVFAVDIGNHRTQVRVSMQPKQPVDMKRPSFVGLDSTKIVDDAPEYRLLSHFDIMLKEQRHLPVEEDGRAHGVGNGQPQAFVRHAKALQE
ncbi:hypothetical protein BFJ66_g18365, partial [Fusarium oxysporum f. sp. cepae]